MAAVGVLLTVSAPAAGAASSSATTTPIKHFIYLMQGARSFDNYFGTYPGAAGFPAGECQRSTSGPGSACVRPYSLDGESAGPSGVDGELVAAQIDDGRMDGFVSAFAQQGRSGQTAMGYYDGSELPTDWAAAGRYVLFDHFYSDADFGTTANRSDWVAAADPGGNRVPAGGYGNLETIFDRLDAAGVSWKFYVQDYNPKDAGLGSGRSVNDQTARVPLLDYARFLDTPQLRGHIVDLSQYYVDLADGTLPAVAYVASSAGDEQSAHGITAGQRLIQTMVNQLMVSRFWSSSAFLWSYDQSGGWFDQDAPPKTAAGSLGLRVPAVLVSAYAKQGSIDATTSDPESAMRFIEQNWGLTPLTARDADANSLAGAFDFSAGPRPAQLLPGPATTAPETAAADPRTGPATTLYTALAAGCLILLAVIWAAALRRGCSLGESAGHL